MDRKKYQVVLMDVDGTLLDFNKAEVLGIREVMKAYGVEPTMEREALYHEINKGLWESFERGEIPKQRIMDTRFSLFFGKIQEEICGGSCESSRFGRDGGFFGSGLTELEFGIRAEKLYRQQLNEGAFLISGALEVCRYLSEKYPVYVVTNGVSETQYHRIEKAGLHPYFKDIFVSEAAGSQKPQKEFFQYCFSKMPSCSPEHMIIIGDSLTSDIKGGCAAGTDTCWYNPVGSGSSYYTNPEKWDKDIRIDYEIEDLLQIRGIL